MWQCRLLQQADIEFIPAEREVIQLEIESPYVRGQKAQCSLAWSSGERLRGNIAAWCSAVRGEIGLERMHAHCVGWPAGRSA